MTREWTQVTKRNPCPACGGDHWCAWSASGMLKCERTSEAPLGMKLVSRKNDGAVFKLDESSAKPKALAPRWKPPLKKEDVPAERKEFNTAEAAIDFVAHRLGRPEGVWDYHDESGTVIFKSVRFFVKPDSEEKILKPKKTFRPVSLVDGKWIPADPPGKLKLYGLPALLKVTPGGLVVVVEGEKNADRASTLGWTATTSAHGALSADKSDWSPVRGLHLVVLIDHDKEGETYGIDVAVAAYAAGALSVRIVRLAELWPEMPKGGDIVDYLAHRNDGAAAKAEIEGLVTRTPETSPQTPSGPMPSLPFEPVSAFELARTHTELRVVVIEGLLRRGEVMNIVASPKVGKTWLIHELAGAVVSGQVWLGRKTLRGSVLLIDGELHKETLADRMRRVRSKLGLSELDMKSLDVWCLRGQMADVNSIAIALMSTAAKYDIVFLDALYRFLPADEEENSNESIMRTYNRLDEIARALDVSIVVVHHSSKGSQAEKAVTDVGSGAGSQSRAADSHLVVREHEEPGAAVVEAAVRSFPPVAAFVIRRTFPGWELALDLDPLKLKRSRKSKGVARESEQPKPESKSAMTLEVFASDVVGHEPLIRDEIVGRAKTAHALPASEAGSLLKRAEAQGFVRRVQDGPSSPHKFACAVEIAKEPTGRGRGGGKGDKVPTTPGASAPGGCGGGLYPPSPPLPQTPSSQQKTRKTNRAVDRKSTASRPRAVKKGGAA